MNFAIEKMESDFLDKVISGSVGEVEIFLKRGVNVNAYDKGSTNTALHFVAGASFYGWYQREEGSYLKIAELLLKYGANIHAPNNNGVTPLKFVLLRGTITMVKLFLNLGSCCRKFKEGVRNSEDVRNVVKFLLQNSHIFRIFPRDIPILLQFCLKHEDENTFEMLLKWNMDFDINSVLPGMSQPIIHSVVCVGTCKMIKYLVEYGVNIEKTNNNRVTPLHYALQIGRTDHVLYLLKAGASVFWKNTEGQTAIHVAAELGLEPVIIQTILEKGIDINVTTLVNKQTPLHEACRIPCNYETVKFLLKRGANLEARDNLGQTPLFFVMRNYYIRNANLLEYFLELKVDVNIQNLNDDTPLSYALKVCPILNDNIKLLVAHLAIMIADKMNVCKKNVETLKYNVVHNFYSSCNLEINKMKREICSSHKVLFFDFLTKDVEKLSAFVRSVEIAKVLNSGCYLTDFPIYGELLKKRINRAKSRAQLLQNATRAFSDSFRKPLPHVPLNEIFLYLNEKELDHVSKALSDGKQTGKFE